MRKFITAATLSLTAGTMALVAPDASAATEHGCAHPQVCFYRTAADFDREQPTAAYQDVTSEPQELSTTAYGAEVVHNSRTDDGALVTLVPAPGEPPDRRSDVCVDPHVTLYIPASSHVSMVRIVDSPDCSTARLHDGTAHGWIEDGTGHGHLGSVDG